MALLDCSKARDLLGFEPEYSWQKVLRLNEDGTPRGTA
jgi:nucleoside-diphosphate-sugar epimerase